MAYGTFRKRALAEDIAQRILTLIQDKELQPGDRLPSARELAAEMQVSIPVLREALRALALMNIIEIRHGSGAYVTSLSPDLLVEHLDFVLSLEDKLHSHVFETRRILEVGAVARAAEQITDEEIAEMEHILARTAERLDDPEAFLQLDLEFHDAIVRATHNPILIRFMLSIRCLGEEIRRRSLSFGDLQMGLEHHQSILAALKAHDVEASRQAMLDHLSHAEMQLKRLLLAEEQAPKGNNG